jgi:ubiquinone/menaquinone biosynthesis C-methylase UbiE
MMDIVSYQDQQSVDVVISIASIQHLHYRHRQALWNEVYRILNYGGKHITANWSYSWWFFMKHWNAIIAGRVLQIFNRKTFSGSDYIIPFQTPQTDTNGKEELKTEYRFYHIYERRALKRLARVA